MPDGSAMQPNTSNATETKCEPLESPTAQRIVISALKRRNSPSVDHIHAVALGGRHEMANVRAVCIHCNLSQGIAVRRELRARRNRSA